MAVKIIERCEPRGKIHRFHCGKCLSVLEATIKDRKYVSNQLDGDAVVVACPVCGKENRIAEEFFR